MFGCPGVTRGRTRWGRAEFIRGIKAPIVLHATGSRESTPLSCTSQLAMGFLQPIESTEAGCLMRGAAWTSWYGGAHMRIVGANRGCVVLRLDLRVNGFKVFSATMYKQRDQLGETVTAWLASHVDFKHRRAAMGSPHATETV